jgi:CheY-like chemotaxis protein
MMTILVVDDEGSVADVLSAILTDEGYRVVTAENGREGLARVAESHPDLVLSDVMMPLLDGRELCRAIKSDPVHSAIPVVLMSAVADKVVGSDCNYNAFIHKPFDLNTLLDLIARLLARPNRPRQDASTG